MPEGHVIRWGEKQAFFELGLKKVYHDEVKVTENTYKEWLKETTATEWFKTELGHSGLGVMQEKDIGSQPARDRMYYGVEKTHVLKSYGLALVVQHEVLKWDLHGVFQPITRELAKTAVTRYDLVAYGIPNNLFSTSDSTYTDYNGQALCSTAHTRMDGGTWKNRPTTDIGLSQTALRIGTTDIRKTVNERGIYVDATYMPKLLMTSVENEWLANTLLKSNYNPDNANMTVNNAKTYGFKIHTSPYITSTTHWSLWRDKGSLKIEMAKGEAPDLQSDKVPGTRDMLFNSYCSFRIEVYEGRGIYGSTGV